MTPVLWTICTGLENLCNLCSFKPIRSEVAGGTIFVEKTRQWAYIELDLQGTPPKSHINIKNDGFSKCISGFKYGVILGIHVSFRGCK